VSPIGHAAAGGSVASGHTCIGHTCGGHSGNGHTRFSAITDPDGNTITFVENLRIAR